MRSQFRSIVTVVVLLLFVVSANAQPTNFANTAGHTNTAGEFEVKSENGNYQSALLLNTAITGEVHGLIATITVEQTFQNDGDDWVNGRYVFPLPESAAVDRMTITIGERVIEGTVKEKAQAKKVFEQAKRQGKKAALLQQHRPNLFSLAVANVAPKSKIITRISYIERIDYSKQTFSLRLPTTLTPRYIPGLPLSRAIQEELATEIASNIQKNIVIGSGGWAQNTNIVADANEITPSQFHDTQTSEATQKLATSSHFVSLNLNINAGFVLDSISSNSHKIYSQLDSSNSYSVQLVHGKARMNQDILLSWKPVLGTAPSAALFQQKLAGEQYSMLMFMPPNLDVANALPRDVTFIVDSSGSMAGASMLQAKASLRHALSTLSPSDRFNLVDFDSSFTPLFDSSQPVEASTLAAAQAMITGLLADGGTEMKGALEFALNQQHSENTLNQIIFITDGSIGNEKDLFELIHNKLGDRRLFTVGIGSAPNSYFMRKAAKFGRGSYTYVNNVNGSAQVMSDLFKKITRPVLRDIKINWPSTVEHYPSKIPDLYISEPLIVYAKSKSALNDVEVTGTLLDQQWKRSLKQTQKPSNSTDHNSKNLDTLWAREKIASLMEQMLTGELAEHDVKPKVVALGLTHQIVSRFTSFVAIEKQASRPSNAKTKQKNVANLMPNGSVMQAPQTASPAALLGILGMFLIFLAQCFRSPKLKTFPFFSRVKRNV